MNAALPQLVNQDVETDDDDDESMTMEERLTLLEESKWEAEQEVQRWKAKAKKLAAQLEEGSDTVEQLSGSYSSSMTEQHSPFVLDTSTAFNISPMTQHKPFVAGHRDSLNSSMRSTSESMRSTRSISESHRASNVRIESLVNQLEGTDQEVPFLQEENEILQAKIKGLEKELGQKSVVLLRLKNLLEGARSRESDLKVEIDDLEQIMRGMEKEIMLLESENEELKGRQGDELMLRMKMLLEKARARESVANKKSKDLQGEVHTLESIIKTLEEDNRKLAQDKDKEDSKEKEHLEEQEMQSLREENARLLSKLRQMVGALKSEKLKVKSLEAKMNIAPASYVTSASGKLLNGTHVKVEHKKRDGKLREERANKEKRLRERLKLLAGMSSR